MLHIIYSDESAATDLTPGPWYCRVGVVERPSPPTQTHHQTRQKIAALYKRGSDLGIFKEELSGTRLLRGIAETDPSNDAERLKELERLAQDLCNLVGQEVDVIVVSGKNDQRFESLLASLPPAERIKETAVQIETCARFLVACRAWLVETDKRLSVGSHGQRSPMIHLKHAALVCFDNVTTPHYMRAIFESYADVLSSWTNGRHYVARLTFVPSQYDLLIQLADVFGAFIRQRLEGQSSKWYDSIRARHDASWLNDTARRALWFELKHH